MLDCVQTLDPVTDPNAANAMRDGWFDFPPPLIGRHPDEEEAEPEEEGFDDEEDVDEDFDDEEDDDFDDEDLDDAVVIDESRSTPAVLPALRRNVPGPATQQEQFRQQRYGTAINSNLANRQRYNPPPKFNETNRLPPPAPNAQHAPKVEQEDAEQAPVTHVSSLQRQIDEVKVSVLKYYLL